MGGGLLKGPTVQDIVTEMELSERGSQTFPLENKLLYVTDYLHRMHLVSVTYGTKGSQMSGTRLCVQIVTFVTFAVITSLKNITVM